MEKLIWEKGKIKDRMVIRNYDHELTIFYDRMVENIIAYEIYLKDNVTILLYKDRNIVEVK